LTFSSFNPNGLLHTEPRLTGNSRLLIDRPPNEFPALLSIRNEANGSLCAMRALVGSAMRDVSV